MNNSIPLSTHRVVEAIDAPPADVSARTPQKLPRFPLLRFDQIKVDTTRRRYLIKGLLASTGLAVIWGPPKCGKSFSAMDMAMHIALGWEYRGQRVQQAPVVYVALEGQEGFPARVEAFRRHHNVTAAPFFLMTTRLNLIADARPLVADIKAQIGDVMPGAVFIDTLNRSLVGSESKDEDMAKYLAGADFVADQLACAVPIVHHCGIDASRPRGHTSLTGSVESQLAVNRGASGEVIVTVEYAKDFAEGIEVYSRLDPVTVGTDPDGDEITTLVVVPAEHAPGKTGKKIKLAPTPLAGLRHLNECLAERGKVPLPSEHIPAGKLAVTLDQWRDQLTKAGILNAEGNPREQFRRIRVTLLNVGNIGVWEGNVWAVT